MAQEPRIPRKPIDSSNIRFGPFELDVRTAELRKNGSRIRLQDQPFQILSMLLDRAGEVVTRDEIRGRLWPDNTVVEFDHSINAAIKRLRDALQESADQPRYIETLARRGYRFTGEIEPPPAGPDLAAAAPEPVVAPALDSPDPGRESVEAKNPPLLPVSTRRHGASIFLAASFLLAIAGGWYWYHVMAAPIRWARDVALPEATRLVDAGNATRAFSLILRAQQVLPADPTLSRLRREISHPVTIRTEPAGAEIWVKAYEDPDGQWLPIGKSPIENFLLPLGYFRWRITKGGFRTVEGADGFQRAIIDFALDSNENDVPAEMVHVPAGAFQLSSLAPVQLDDYWIDKYEVTNRQFRQFIDQGGYRNRRFWREKFIQDGRVLSWEEAATMFRDLTGKPGPSGWELGDYPAGQDDFPVGGVSWYEAAAYAEFSGKQLPTLYHWYRAAGLGIYSDILFFSNFNTNGPVRVGSLKGIGPFGTYDMAGNAREWCSNISGGRRYIAGGAWNDQRYVFSDMNAVTPFDRSPANGFRLAKRLGAAFPDALTRPIEKPSRDYQAEKPVDADAFRILQSMYSYDHTDMNAREDSVNEISRVWTSKKITFDAAYDHQRVTALLYFPKNSKPPYQTIVYVPPRSARYLSTIDEFEIKFIEFLVKTGRAVLFPICQGMYDRRQTAPPGLSGERDLVIQQTKDLRRSIDYLEMRPDIDRERLGFYGISDGARSGLILLAQEPRIRAAVLAAGGLSPEKKPAEIDEINFAPRVRVPVLMLNGRYDLFYPAETLQAPLFRLLGAPEKEKRYKRFDIGHLPFQQLEMKETLDWFDRYLGPVSR